MRNTPLRHLMPPLKCSTCAMQCISFFFCRVYVDLIISLLRTTELRPSFHEVFALTFTFTTHAAMHQVRSGHRLWWHSFWPDGGFLTYEYTVLESLYFLMQYKFGSAARRGRAFMDLNGPWLIDGAKQEPVDCLPSEEVALFY